MRTGIQKDTPAAFRLADVVRRACAASWRAASWIAGLSLTKLAGCRRRDTESQCLSRRDPAPAPAHRTQTGVVFFGDASHVGMGGCEGPRCRQIATPQPSGAGDPVPADLHTDAPRHAMCMDYAVQCIVSCSSATGSQRCCCAGLAGARVAACR
jgi:hypothetical protein